MSVGIRQRMLSIKCGHLEHIRQIDIWTVQLGIQFYSACFNVESVVKLFF